MGGGQRGNALVPQYESDSSTPLNKPPPKQERDDGRNVVAS